MCDKGKRSVWCISLVSVALAVVLAGPAQAVVDPYAPDYRGDPNSVHAIFEWVSHGQAAWNVFLSASDSGGYELDPTTPSASDDGMDTTVNLPNFIDPLPLKLMRIQLFFDGAVEEEAIDGEITAYDPTGQVQIVDAGSSDLGLSVVHYFDFELYPNPDREQMILFGNEAANVLPGNLWRIEVDTVSIVPEPATLSVLGLALGGFALLRRKRST